MSRKPAVCPVRMTVGRELVEITFGNGFTPHDIAAIKALPGRRWDRRRRAWLLPNRPESIEAIERRFGSRLVRSGAPDASVPWPEELLMRMREKLTLRGYSRRTHKVYLGHVRRFFEWSTRDGGECRHAPSVEEVER